ncbi:GNAT family N-acetyltransferase [Candidatus Harpocratesius sp.]
MKIDYSKVVFRKLKAEDLPQVEEISKDIWDGQDYVPKVFHEWLKDPEGYTFGLFLPNNSEFKEQILELIAIGRVKFISKEIAWMEGGRVKKSYQQRGIGKILTEHAIQVAVNRGSKIIQYATYTENTGSIALALRFGFTTKNTMIFLKAEVNNLKLDCVEIDENFSNITPDQAFKFAAYRLKEKPDDINTGFSYFPNQLRFFQKFGKDFHWYANDKALLRVEYYNSSDNQDGPQKLKMWCTLYGEPKKAYQLLISYLNIKHFQPDKSLEGVELFTTKEIAEIVLQFGFQYYEDHETGVLLFEKKID